MPQNIFLNLSIILGITAAVAFVVRTLRQPLLIAYLIAGIAVGPFFLNVLRGAALERAFADIGVVLLLFVVGLSLNLRHLREVGRPAVLAGVGQFAFTAIVGFLILLTLPLPMLTRAYLAVAVTFSSTIIIVKLLAEKGDTERMYGRQVIGLMVIQDLLAIALLVVLSTLHSTQGVSAAFGMLAARGVTVILAIILAARYVLPQILDRAARSTEHLFLTTVTWCFLVASAMSWAGFSLEVGALAAGLALAASPYQPEIASRIRPLRDFFLVLFFVILGGTMRFDGLASAIIPGAILSAFILIGNPLILYGIYRRLRFTRRNSFLAALTAAQVSEFGFVLLLTGERLGHIGERARTVFTITALVTIIISTYLIHSSEAVFRLLRPFLARFGHDYRQPDRDDALRYDAWVFGGHRTGSRVVQALRAASVPLAAVDDSPRVIERLTTEGVPAYFGDASDAEFLDELPLHGARLVVSTIPDVDTQLVLIEHLRRHVGRGVRVIATAEHASHLDDLYRAGADYVTLPHLVGGAWLAGVLTEKRWVPATFSTLRRAQRRELAVYAAV